MKLSVVVVGNFAWLKCDVGRGCEDVSRVRCVEVVVVRACKPVNGSSAVMVGSANLRGGRPMCFGSGEVGV